MQATLEARQTQPGVAVPDLDITQVIFRVYRALGRELGYPVMAADSELVRSQDVALAHNRPARAYRQTLEQRRAWLRERQQINAEFTKKRWDNLINYLAAIGRMDLLNITPAQAGD